MIGLVGPPDSVEGVQAIARESGLAGDILARTYGCPAQAPALTRALDQSCRVVLFTGEVPYQLARRSCQAPTASLLYIAHAATDLYRCLAHLLLDGAHRGRIPPLSVDVMAPEVVAEVLDDLGVAARRVVLGLGLDADGGTYAPELLAARHAELYRRGSVRLCLTCLDGVYRLLDEAGVPAVRVAHTRPSVRDALMRAALEDSMRTAEHRQLAVALLQAPDVPARESLKAMGRTFAGLLGATVFQVRQNTVMIQATRGDVEAFMRTYDPAGPGAGDGLRPILGFGFAPTAVRAQVEAERALAYAHAQGLPFATFEGGTPRSPSADGPAGVAQDPAAFGQRAAELGLAPLTLYRVAGAFKRIDAAVFTAEDFAAAYGSSPRTARRLIGRLRQVGVVREEGVVKGPGAGRPTTTFAADLERLFPGGGASAWDPGERKGET